MFQRYDYGVQFTTTFTDRVTGDIIDMSGVSSVDLRFRAPDNTTTLKSATIESPTTSGIASYIVESGLLDKVGVWSYQYTLNYEDSSRYSDVGTFRVNSNL